MADNEKYKGKYRIPSARWAAWDYGANAAYFVTICTAKKRCYFGTIVNGPTVETHDYASHDHAPETETQDIASLPIFTAMQYSPLGLATVDCWLEIPAHFPFVELGEFVVMPNHVHGVLIINKQESVPPVETHDYASVDTASRGNASHDTAPETETQYLPSKTETQYLASHAYQAKDPP